ncbi:MAG: helix-turn-helix transcriptional regulator [Baekduiaceae bacterium]
MTNLETIRRNRNLQQQELATSAGVPQATISRVESGKGTTLRSALKIARALSLSVEEVFGDVALDDGTTPLPGSIEAATSERPSAPPPATDRAA